MLAEDKLKNFESLMQLRGLIGTSDLLKELNISRATLMRLLAQQPSKWVSIGKTRNQQYGWLRSVPDLGHEVPVFRVDETGNLLPIARLNFLEKNLYVTQPDGQVFDALPPEINDMAPQGFMGRIFAKNYDSELGGLPHRLEDWSDAHILKSTAKRGEDFPGNLIIGEESAQRFQKLSYSNTTPQDFTHLLDQALNMGSVVSSAGGERPKFTAVMESSHVIVKFAGPLSQADQRRWADLLYCESVAYSVLQQADVDCIETKVWPTVSDYIFLISTRFDRVGLKGRTPYLSFAAVDAYLFGDQQTWSHTAEKLFKSNKLSKEDFEKVCLVEAFAQLIGDTDRHFYNMGLIPEFDSPSSLTPNYFHLAPIFDKSPMAFAPYDGRVLEKEFEPGVPKANLVHVWEQAVRLAKSFWERVQEERAISESFRQIAAGCLKKL